jgi:hypothetical protein
MDSAAHVYDALASATSTLKTRVLINFTPLLGQLIKDTAAPTQLQRQFKRGRSDSEDGVE